MLASALIIVRRRRSPKSVPDTMEERSSAFANQINTDSTTGSEIAVYERSGLNSSEYQYSDITLDNAQPKDLGNCYGTKKADNPGQNNMPENRKAYSHLEIKPNIFKDTTYSHISENSRGKLNSESTSSAYSQVSRVNVSKQINKMIEESDDEYDKLQNTKRKTISEKNVQENNGDSN
ncbi:uncharacterized protein LOC128556370 [Mercenaria mercenaria]|uniref:uncharacterized protein LOC128556370 n=1 Tax=Mercenaria mercenaria TaxID=6596 RepID=UPI00234F8E49|nr:uncharacterized protein LOC128556370 [Mercenaria mercenaria]